MDTLDFENRNQTETTPKVERIRGDYDTFGNVQPRVLDFGEVEKPKNTYHREQTDEHDPATNDGVGAAREEEDDAANRLKDLNDHVSVMDNQS